MTRRSVPIPAALLVLSLSLVIPIAPAAAAGGDVIHHGGFAAGDLGWAREADGSVRPLLAGTRALDATDRPALPARDLLLLVPAHLAVGGVVVEPIRTTGITPPGPLALAGPLRTSTGETLAVAEVAAAEDGAFPARWGRWGGLHTWRGYRLLAVTIHPLRVQVGGEEPQLELLTEYRVRVLTTGAAAPPVLARERQVPGERARNTALLSSLVDNPDAVSGYQRDDGVLLDRSGAPHLPAPLPSLDGTGVRYLIVTTEELAPEFQRLADHRTAMGLPAEVVTREWISANYRQGIDFQETLRGFLQDAYARWGLEYLLIGGDTDVIPTRFVRSSFYPFGGHTDIPTDLYYAALDGNWGADGDGWLGEPYVNETNPGDDADMAPELGVGRAPVRNPNMVSDFVDKVLAYESAPATAAWANRVLFASEVLFPSPWDPGDPITLDGAQYSDNLIGNVVDACSGLEPLRMYETDQLFPRDAALSREAFIDSLNTGHYGQVNQFGHGHFFNMSMGDANFTVSDADALTNPNSFLLFAVNCASGAFDVSCLMERFVENPDGGAIISVGAAREAFPSNSFGYQTAFYENLLCDDLRRPADALIAARLQYINNTNRNTVDRWTQQNLVMIGDPALSVWTTAPRPAAVDAPAGLVVGEQTVDVTVTVNGQPVPGVEVCLRKDGETYAWDDTNFQGTASLTVIPRTAGQAVLTIAGADVVLTSRTIPVTAPGSYVGAGDLVTLDAAENGNGVFEAGETVDITLTLEESGGLATGALDVELVSTHPALVVVDGQTTAPALAAGGTTTIDGLQLRALADTEDGRVVDLRVIASDGEHQWVSTVPVKILAPETAIISMVVDDATHGDGDNVWEAGERLVLIPQLKNYGAGRLDGLVGTINPLQDGVIVHSSSATFTAAELLETSTLASGELSLALSDMTATDPCELVFTDNHGRVVRLPVEFLGTDPPVSVETDATLAADAIVLRWEAADGERARGYHVYRAESPDGPWVRANPDLLQGISYYEDRGLAELTPYWYRITTVDRSYLESTFSAVVTQGTMPPEIDNFPLPFQLQTSGHPAVGDVDGDGVLEVVLTSDEVYVWRPDGSEIRDGDEDPQTTGPFTGVGGEFSPAGPVLADLDGEPGLEIVASLLTPQREIHVYDHTGAMLPGWPRPLRSSWNWAPPSVGDVDGDGQPEIVVNDLGGRTFAWNADGTELRDGDDDPATDGVFLVRPEGWGFSSPALHDLDGDGAAEMIFGTSYSDDQNGLLAYAATGEQVRGFPFETGSERILCSPAVADLDGDGQREIIFFSTGRKLYVVREDGSAYPGFPVSHPGAFDGTLGAPSPGVGDLDGDGQLEIVWPVNSGTFRLDILVVDTGIADGSAGDVLPGWPVELPANTEASPVIGDIDGDGVPDIVQPIGNSETDTPDLVYALAADGSVIAGFPIRLDGHPRSTPVLCDLEGDGDVDIVYGSWDRLLHVWDMPATWDPSRVPWPTFQGNMQRTGVVPLISWTAVEDEVDVPAAFTVLPPFPNPFNPVTTIRLYVAPGSDRRLEVGVYDLRGRRVRQLFTGQVEPGWRELVWDGSDDAGRRQASGVYFVRARQADRTQTFKMSLVK